MRKFPLTTIRRRSFILKSSKGKKGYKFSRYHIGIRALMTGYLVFKHFETARVTLVRLTRPKRVKNKKNLKYIQSALKGLLYRRRRKRRAKRKIRLCLRGHLNVPFTAKPLQVRMGKGKGSTTLWANYHKPSRLVMEVKKIKGKLYRIRKYLDICRQKFPGTTKITLNVRVFRLENKYLLKKTLNSGERRNEFSL